MKKQVWGLIPWVLFLIFYIYGSLKGAFDELGGLILIPAFCIALFLSLILYFTGKKDDNQKKSNLSKDSV
jgi:hypothetical protein